MKQFFKEVEVTSRSGRTSKSSLFELLASKTDLIRAGNPNFAKWLLQELRRYHVRMGVILSKVEVRSDKFII